MAVGSLSPVAIQQFFDNNGHPLAGGKLGFYLAGTDTPSPAYADIGLTTPLANPVILDAAGRAPELFLAALTYKQVLQTAGDVTLWTADNITTPTALRSTQGIISLTGVQQDVPVPAGVITFLLCQNTAPLTIGGFAGGTPGQILIVRCYSSDQPVHFLNWSHSGSRAGNTIVNFVDSGPTSIIGPGIALFVYASLPHAAGQLHWMLVTHEQGRAINIPYSVANYSVQGPGTWTVSAANQKTLSYYLNGSSLAITYTIQDSSVAGGPSFLNIGGVPYTFGENIVWIPSLITVPPNTIAPAGVFCNSGLNVFSMRHPTKGVFPDLANVFDANGQFSANVL